MRFSLRFATLSVALATVTTAGASAATAAPTVGSVSGPFAVDNAVRDFPIHFDGPLLHQAPATAGGPANGGLPNFHVRWHGGPVQTTSTSYAIYWQPTGTYMSPTYATLIDRFLTDVGGSAIYGMATEYAGSNGYVRNASTFGGSYTDTGPYPATLNDAALQQEAAKVIALQKWTTGPESTYFIMTAKDAIKPGGFCAYHSAFAYRGNKRKPVVYAFVPYFGTVNGCNEPFGISPNNDPAADGAILNLSHEQMEAVTDPLLNAWYGNVGGEIGDICIYSFGTPLYRSGGNLEANNHQYLLQELWSQRHDACRPNL